MASDLEEKIQFQLINPKRAPQWQSLNIDTCNNFETHSPTKRTVYYSAKVENISILFIKNLIYYKTNLKNLVLIENHFAEIWKVYRFG